LEACAAASLIIQAQGQTAQNSLLLQYTETLAQAHPFDSTISHVCARKQVCNTYPAIRSAQNSLSSMTSAAPQDGGSSKEKLKEKLKHPFDNMREKFRDSSLYDLKVGFIHKKYLTPLPSSRSFNILMFVQTRDWKVCKLGELRSVYRFEPILTSFQDQSKS